ncbi:MAG: hypothetical protein AAGA68_16535 [Pseudomonadota bacterium]
MAIKGLEYLYMETHDWEGSKAFWQSLGFELIMSLGTAGKFVHPESEGAVFLEQVSEDREPAMRIYLTGDRHAPVPVPEASVSAPWSQSHWGSHLLELVDPDGRPVIVQDRD